MEALKRLSPEYLQAVGGSNQPLQLALSSGDTVTLVPLEHFELKVMGIPGWEVVSHYDTVVGVDTRLSVDLKGEGMAREVVRHVQQARKDAGLEMEDRITLYLQTESQELRQAIDAHRDYIAAETLTVRWSDAPLGDGAHTANVKVDGQALMIQLRKA
jgi:isoleucyl-tRNA synthetase